MSRKRERFDGYVYEMVAEVYDRPDDRVVMPEHVSSTLSHDLQVHPTSPA